jgi:hypothetical protein
VSLLLTMALSGVAVRVTSANEGSASTPRTSRRRGAAVAAAAWDTAASSAARTMPVRAAEIVREVMVVAA